MDTWLKYKNHVLVTVIFVLTSLYNNSEAQEQTVGLFINEPAAFEGYTLFAPNASTTTYLIDMDGLLVHKWESEYTPTQTAYFLENGNLLRSAHISSGGSAGGGFQILDWDSNVLWEYGYDQQHHDIEPLPNGNVLLITNAVKTKAQAIAAGRDPDLIDNKLRVLHILEIARTDSGTSEILWEWKLWDHLIQDFDSTKANYGVVENHPELMDINFASDGRADWIHSNAIDYHPQFNQIVVTNRGVNEIWIIDHSTTTEEAASHEGGNSGRGGDLLYRWGNPAAYRAGTAEDQKLFAHHDTHWIEPGLNGAGNILIFNNGLGRPEGPFSTIDEITLPVDSLGNYTLTAGTAFAPDSQTWLYKAKNPTDFYSPRFSGAQRLPNGNTLICSGVGGTFFEVAPDSDIVWKYVNPVDNGEAVTQGDTVESNDVGRCYRYGPDFPGFAGKDLTPGDPIEKYDTAVKAAKGGVPVGFILYNNYPNPFNPATAISYQLSEVSNVELTVYNTLGQKVRTLVNERQEAGKYSVKFSGRGLASGIYYYRLKAYGYIETKKMILLQ